LITWLGGAGLIWGVFEKASWRKRHYLGSRGGERQNKQNEAMHPGASRGKAILYFFRREGTVQELAKAWPT